MEFCFAKGDKNLRIFIFLDACPFHLAGNINNITHNIVSTLPTTGNIFHCKVNVQKAISEIRDFF
ncbi:MAG: hypothetical protein ACOYJF_09965, partial [Prevotella sp.]